MPRVGLIALPADNQRAEAELVNPTGLVWVIVRVMRMCA